MKLGLNLSFAVKRWLEPEYVAKMLREDLDVQYIQFSWDIVDPWWPSAPRDALAKQWADAFRKEGLVLSSTFSGMASYTFPQLLAPTKEMRDISVQYFKRAMDMTAAMGTDTVGYPLGGMTHHDAFNHERREQIYHQALDLMHELASYAKTAGLSKILIEPTPVFTEYPSTPQECQRLMKDLDGTTDVPVLLLIDWGHALMESYLGEDANVEVWLRQCEPYIDSFHLQQSDGKLDRHWGFTSDGVVNVSEIQGLLQKYDLGSSISFLEAAYPIEMTDKAVLEDIKKSMEYLYGATREG